MLLPCWPFFFFFLNYGCTDNWLQQTSLLAATSLSANKMMFSDGSGWCLSLVSHQFHAHCIFKDIVRKAEWVLKKVDLWSSGSFLCFQCMEKVRKINRSMSASGQTVCLVFFQTWLSIWALNFTAGASLPFMKYLELIEVHTVCCFSRVGSNCRNPLLWTMQWLLKITGGNFWYRNAEGR